MMDGLGETGRIVCFTGIMVSVAGNRFIKISTFLRFLRLPAEEEGEWEVECLEDLLESSGINTGVLGVAS